MTQEGSPAESRHRVTVWRTPLLIVLAALPLLIGASSAGSEELAAGATPAAGSAIPRETEIYARDFGITEEEAGARFATMESARELQTKLRATGADYFGGLWINHRPFEVVINVVSGYEEQIISLIASSGLGSVARVSTTRFTESELHRDQDAVPSLVPFGKDFWSGINLRTGHVEVYVDAAADVPAFRDADFGPSVVITQRAMPEPAVSIYGGLHLSVETDGFCTSGFSMQEQSGTTEGISTAGHCHSPVKFSGTTLPLVDVMESGNVDARWHTTPGFTDPNLIRVNSSGTTSQITSRRHRNDMMVGDVVCKYGDTTNYDCGTIDDTSSFGCVPSVATFIYVNNNSGDMAEGGDSGAPVFTGNASRAWGIVTCQDGQSDGDDGDMIFMAQNYFSQIGALVDIS
jgi:streptogrisin C